MNPGATRRLQAVSLSPAAQAWLATTQQAYVLHVFEHVINLVNQEGDVLSLAHQALGNGPFSLLLEAMPEGIAISSQLLVFENGLWFGEWLVDAEEAVLWQPRPDWHALQAQSDFGWVVNAITQILQVEATDESLAHLVVSPLGRSTLPARIQQAAEQHMPLLWQALKANDPSLAAQAAKGLAGLGPGLTPAGDDLLLGALFALWASAPSPVAEALGHSIGSAAIPRTHQLSAAWLAAGMRGEAPELWHKLFVAIANNDVQSLGQVAMRILPTGHSSGADALAGFIGGLQALAEAAD